MRHRSATGRDGGRLPVLRVHNVVSGAQGPPTPRGTAMTDIAITGLSYRYRRGADALQDKTLDVSAVHSRAFARRYRCWRHCSA